MIEFTIISGLIILNALFVAAEFAIVGAPRASIDARAAAGNRLAQMVQRVLHDPVRQDRYIATAQLGITLVELDDFLVTLRLADGTRWPTPFTEPSAVQADLPGSFRTALRASPRSPS